MYEFEILSEKLAAANFNLNLKYSDESFVIKFNVEEKCLSLAIKG